MSNSSLINYTILSPNYGTRTLPISKITIHHAAAVGVDSRRIAQSFQPVKRQASSNYTIGVNGDITLVVPEEYCPWTSGTWNEPNHGNDGIAVTIEVANDGGEPDWHVSDKTLESIINLCVDICKRNNIEALNFTGDATGNLTQHNYFQPTRCPGEYLKTKFTYIADEVNRRLGNNMIIPDPIDVFYAVYANQWLDEVKNYNEIDDNGYAGWHGKPMTGIKARLSEGSIVYRVHTLHSGWLDWVTDHDEAQGGYAGIYEQPIDGIQMYLKGLPENYHVEYRVGLLGGGPQPWIRDFNPGIWSGTLDKQFDKFQIRIIADPVYIPVEEKKEETVQKEIYRVRASWDDALSQIGAFSNLDSAIVKAKEHGYNVYNSKGEVVYETPIEPAPIPESEVVAPSPELIPTPEVEPVPSPEPEPETEITSGSEPEHNEEILDNEANVSEDIVEPAPKKVSIFIQVIKAILNTLINIFKKK